jgi:cytochrome c peroxidase
MVRSSTKVTAFTLACWWILPAYGGEVQNGKNGPAPAYNRAAWKAKYVRPRTIPFPPGNRLTPDREHLGRTLFFDPRLSLSKTISCATCHNPGFSWTDGLPKAIGHGMKEQARRTPTILNVAWADVLFWDGRAESLEEQALKPISAPGEMNQDLDKMVQTVANIPSYARMFAHAYPGVIVSAEAIGLAIATFERTVVSGIAPFDRWISGNEGAISQSAKRGFDAFNSTAGCQQCHSGWNLTDNGFHDIGIAGEDKGRGALLPLEAMQHAFKTPTLRNVAERAPFMHDGSEPTLADAVELYDLGGRVKRPSLASEIHALHLSAADKTDLIEFLKTLTGADQRPEFPVLPR